jgi:hypothetical protein
MRKHLLEAEGVEARSNARVVLGDVDLRRCVVGEHGGAGPPLEEHRDPHSVVATHRITGDLGDSVQGVSQRGVADEEAGHGLEASGQRL